MIAILTPYLRGQSITPHCEESARALEAAGMGHWYRCENNGGVLADIRNRMLDSIEGEYRHALFLDSDVGVPVGAVMAAQSLGVPVVGIGYQLHNERSLCAGMWLSMTPGLVAPSHTRVEGPESERVDWVGAGALLIDMQALRALERPYFRYEWLDTPDGRRQTGEDIGFCVNCDENDVPIYLIRSDGVMHARNVNCTIYDRGGHAMESTKHFVKQSIDGLRGIIMAEIGGVQRIGENIITIAQELNAAIEALEAERAITAELRAKVEELGSEKPKRKPKG